MTKKTRTFLFVSAAILAVGLGTGLVASYMGVPGLSRLTTSGPEELRYVPRDATLVAYANVRDVMQSELRQKMRKFDGKERGREDLQEKTGINLETDVDRVVACLTREEQATGRDGGLVLARGRFDEVRIEGLVREHGGTVEQYKGKRIIVHTAEAREREGDEHPRNATPMALVFLEPGLVAFGSQGAVREAVDLQGGGQNVTDNRELMDLVKDMDSGNAWAVGRFDALASRAKLPVNVTSQLPPITWFAATGHVNGGLNGMLRAEARDEQAAQNLRDVVRGFMALAKLQAGSNPGMATMLDSLQLTGDGKTVAVAFSVPSEAFDALEAAGRMKRRGPAGHGDGEPGRFGPPAPPEPPMPPAPPLPDLDPR